MACQHDATKLQELALVAISALLKRHGQPPTLAELSKEMLVSQTQMVGILRALEQRRLVDLYNHPRGIRMLDAGWRLAGEP